MTRSNPLPDGYVRMSKEERPPGSPLDFEVRPGGLEGAFGTSEAEIIAARLIIMMQVVGEWCGIRALTVFEHMQAPELMAEELLLAEGLIMLEHLQLIRLVQADDGPGTIIYPTRELAEHPGLNRFRNSTDGTP